jgi:hypothetical protein
VTLRRSRPGERVERERCMFEKCRHYGERVNLSGRHERVLCDADQKAIREALTQPGLYRVTWGLSGTEKRERDEAEVADLLRTYGDLPEDWYSGKWIDEWERENPHAYHAYEEDEQPPLPTTQERAWERIAYVRERLDDIDPAQQPIVRVSIRTEDVRRF